MPAETPSGYNCCARVLSYFQKPHSEFCQLQLHLHMGLTVLQSLDRHVYFFAEGCPRFWKGKTRWLFQIPAGHQKGCSSL